MHPSIITTLTVQGSLMLLAGCSFSHKTGGPCSRSERPIIRTYTESTPSDTIAEVFVSYDAGSCAPLPALGATMACVGDAPCLVLGPDVDDMQRFRVAVDAPGERTLRVSYVDPVHEGQHFLEHTITFTDPNLIQTGSIAIGARMLEKERWILEHDGQRFTCRPLEDLHRYGVASTATVTTHGCQPELEVAPGQTRLVPDHWSPDIAPAMITCAVLEDGVLTHVDTMKLTPDGYVHATSTDRPICHQAEATR